MISMKCSAVCMVIMSQVECKRKCATMFYIMTVANN